ncbi:MAG: DUF389 domain-containing protein [Acidimicrobiia bacterium]|nr:DUF389 domain-containing protein [Acidimicrobiia bacterium]
MPLLRVAVAATHTDAVVSLLLDEPTCVGVAVERGAVLQPPADLVLAELGRVSVDTVVESVADIPGIRVWLQDSEPLVVPGSQRIDRDDAVMWARVADLLSHSLHISTLFVLLIMLSGGIAAVGILSNQLLLIVGAMALSPDYFPLIAGCLAVVRRRFGDVVHSVVTLAVGFALAAVAAWGLVLALDWAGVVQLEPANEQSVLLFISSPSWLSLVVALMAGVAGALSVTLSDNRALVGVFVSITTIPAAAAIGVGVAAGTWDSVVGAAGQLAVNVVALYVAGTLTLWGQRAYWARRVPSHVRHLLGGRDAP